MAEKLDSDLLVNIDDLRIWYRTTKGAAKAVDGVSLALRRNEVFGLAGESGCGKSTLARGLLGLTRLPAYVESGEVVFYQASSNATKMGVDLLSLKPSELRRMRWRHLAYIPQSAMNVLNPVMRIENQILDAILEHTDWPRTRAVERMYECLETVGLERSVAHMYPHELSGGMKQRVAIAAAISLSPELIVADEPTTALDVNVQQVILQELKEVREQLGLTLLYVTHDMAVHAELADRMGIMYSGLIVEVASVFDVFKEPLHPYTQALIDAIPRLGGPRVRLQGLVGRTPSPLAWPPGCRFHPRCPKAMPICGKEPPGLREVAPGRLVACHLYR